MHLGYYVLASLAAPFALAVEHAAATVRGRRIYSFAGTINSLSQHLVEMALTVALTLDVFAGYSWLSARIAIAAPPASSWLTWVLTFVAVDGLYYVGHRACHRVGFLWALHAVHHQAPEYNLSVGLRGPWLSALQIAPFMLPLALVGVPTEVLFPVYAVHTLYKLFVHTDLVGDFGLLDALLVSPAQHRVHHATNPEYAGKNYGGVLSVWDRLLGTARRETVAPTFVRADADADVSWNPLRNNVDPWIALARRVRSAGSVSRALRVLISTGAGPGGERPAVRHDVGARAELDAGARIPVATAFGLIGAITVGFLAFGPGLGFVARCALAAAITAAVVEVNRRCRVVREPAR